MVLVKTLLWSAQKDWTFSEPTASDTCDDANNSNGGDMTVSNNGSSFVSWESELDAEDDEWDAFGDFHYW